MFSCEASFTGDDQSIDLLCVAYLYLDMDGCNAAEITKFEYFSRNLQYCNLYILCVLLEMRSG